VSITLFIIRYEYLSADIVNKVNYIDSYEIAVMKTVSGISLHWKDIRLIGKWKARLYRWQKKLKPGKLLMEN